MHFIAQLVKGGYDLSAIAGPLPDASAEEYRTSPQEIIKAAQFYFKLGTLRGWSKDILKELAIALSGLLYVDVTVKVRKVTVPTHHEQYRNSTVSW
jgi:hypothetical protein